MNFSPTDEQLAIASALKSDGPNIMTRAYAGTAKSTTIELAAPGWRKPALALAFNKSTTVELTRRLPEHFTCKSFNGIGHGVVARAIGKKLELDDRKLGKLVTEVSKSANIALTEDQWASVRATASRAMIAGVVPDDKGLPIARDTGDTWQNLAADAGAWEDDLEFIASLAREVLVRNNALTREGIISFDDQVYFSACLAPASAWAKQGLIVVDEAQDMSPLNKQQVERQCSAYTRLMLVGDPLQSIYAFRGAMSNSMNVSRGMRDSWVDLPLTMTFRCPKMIVERQAAHAPGFRAGPGVLPGEFQRFDCEDERWNWRDLPGGEKMILCRNNSPLISLGFKLIRRGIGVQMLGRNIGKGLGYLASKIAGAEGDKMEIEAFISAVVEWKDREIRLAQAAGRERLIERIDDQMESLIASASASEAKNVGQLRKVMEKLFEPKSGQQITLSTPYQAKGLECENVVHLDPWRIPSRYAKDEGGEALVQEANVRYVTETRVRRRLIEANMEDFE